MAHVSTPARVLSVAVTMSVLLCVALRNNTQVRNCAHDNKMT